ncbi:D-alanine--poly(phosphoribitol) ligase subunit 1 [Lactococcus lactis]|nr:D-alanine--poly(phosphoribitol) ligase subunit 1 [Lactococcus lactis]
MQTKKPDLIVLAEREQKFTYRQLFAAVSEISKQIKERTLVNRPILIFGKNDFISLAAMLAANLTGHAYIPVDAHTPFERTEMIKSAAKPAVVITTVNLSEDFSALFTDRISVNLNTLSLEKNFQHLIFLKLFLEMTAIILFILLEQQEYQKVLKSVMIIL